MDEAQEGRVEAQEEGNAPLSPEREAAMIERAEVVLEPDHLAGIAQINEPDGNALAMAIAAHFGVEPEEVTGFVVACEYNHGENMSLSSAWQIGVPIWRLRAIVAELGEHLRSM